MKNTHGPRKGDPILIGFKDGPEQMKIPCIYCGDTHYHGLMDGYRVPHCAESPKKADYYIKLNYIEKLEDNPVRDYDELLSEYKLLLKAYKDSFMLHEEVRKTLNKVEERYGVPSEIYRLVGTKWLVKVIEWLVETNDEKIERFQYLVKKLSSLEETKSQFIPSTPNRLYDQILMICSMDPVHENYVYFLESDGRYKIGRSNNPRKRYHSIKTSSPYPVEFLFAFKAPKVVEKLLHTYFNDLRIHGEWFEDSEELSRLIDKLSYIGEEFMIK